MKTNNVYSLVALPTLVMALCALSALAQPIEINDMDELQRIGNDPAYPLNGDYVLGNDIDASATANWNDGAGFDPVGDVSMGFTGTFDGAGYVIANLTIHRPDEAYVGLFGCTSGATLENIALENVDVTGDNCVGGLVGRTYTGSITSCYSTGAVTGDYYDVGGLVGRTYTGSITSCYSTGAVTGMTGVGGLVGRNHAGSITSCYSTGAVTGDNDVGGLVGSNGSSGSITSCYSTGTVMGGDDVGGLVGSNGSSASITNSYSTGAVTGYERVGGLVGNNGWSSSSSASITSGYNTGTVTGYRVVGGLVGDNGWGSITSCYNTGAVMGGDDVGGLVGSNGWSASITNSYSTGAVTGDWEGVGGLVGSNGSSASIINSYWDTETSGQATSAGGTGKTTALMMEQETFSGWDFVSTWSLCEGAYYPYLQGMTNRSITIGIEPATNPAESLPVIFTVRLSAPVTGFNSADVDFSHSSMSVMAYTVTNTGDDRHYTVAVTAATGMGGIVLFIPAGVCAATACAAVTNVGAECEVAYGWTEINDVDELQRIGNDANYPLHGSYRLGNDIDASVTAGWNDGAGFAPLGDFSMRFTGVFDGAGYVIADLTIHRPDEAYVGLFGYTSGATLQNLVLENVDITGADYVGGLVGRNDDGSITSCYSTGAVMGSEDVGGLVGVNSSSSITNSYSTGAVTGDWEGVGGLVGYNCWGSSITSCYSMSAVTGDWEGVGGLVGNNCWGSSITSCYSMSAVTVEYDAVGGLVGYNRSSASITNSYSTGAVMGSEDVGGLVGVNSSSSITNSYSTGAVTGDWEGVGGLVGTNYDGNMTTCYSTGAVTSGTDVGGLVGYNVDGSITSCYSTGAVTGGTDVGGLVGYNVDGSITSCYWDTETSGQASSDGGTGKSTALMMEQSTFTGWDFVSTWSITEGATYPWLQENEPVEGEGEPMEGELSVPHPADLNEDFSMVLSEAIAYLTGWQQGSNPMGYAIRAAYLWQNGENYTYNSETAPPLCWVLE